MKRFGIISLLLVLGLTLFATADVEVETFFNAKEKERVLNGEIVTRMYVKYNTIGENTDLSIAVPRTKYNDEDFGPYEVVTDEKAFIPLEGTEENRLKLYNTLASFSKLKNMEYWNRGDLKSMVFILDCYRTETKKGKKRIADPVYNEIVPRVENYFTQEDNKFGQLTYKSELFSEGKNFIMVNTCVEALKKYGIPINRKDEYKMLTFFIYDEEQKGYYYYTVTVMRLRMDAVLKRLYPGTFSNRVRGATVHLANLLGFEWDDKINPWDESKLRSGYYKNY